MSNQVRVVASRILRRIHGLSYDDFTDALEVKQSTYWREKFRLMRKNFTEGYFALDEQNQRLLWDYAAEMEQEYERSREPALIY